MSSRGRRPLYLPYYLPCISPISPRYLLRRQLELEREAVHLVDAEDDGQPLLHGVAQQALRVEHEALHLVRGRGRGRVRVGA